MDSSATISQIKPVSRTVLKQQTIAYFAAIVALGLTTSSLGPTLQSLADQTHSNTEHISFLFTARSLGFLIGSFLLSRLYDRKRGHTVMAIMLLIMAAMMAVVPLAGQLFLLALVMTVLGSAEGTMDVGANTLIHWVHRERVAQYMNGLHFFYGVGAVLSPILVVQTMQAKPGITTAYFILAFLTLPPAFLLFRIASPPPLRLAQDDARAVINYRLVVLIAFFFFLYVGAEIGFSSWIYKYAVKLNLSGERGAGYLTSLFWGAFTVGRLVAIPLAAKLRPRTVLFADLLGACASLTLMLLGSTSLPVVLIGTIGIGVSMASIFPTAMTFAGHRIKITGQVTGWFLIGASLGAMFLPWFLGQLFDRLGAQIIITITLIDLALALLVIIILLFTTSRNEKAPTLNPAAHS